MNFVIETIILCGVFTYMIYVMAKDPLKTIYNYPPKIQERVKKLPEYKDIIPTKKDKILSKFTASLVIIFLVSMIMKRVNNITTFADATKYSFIIWSVVNWYDALIIDCLWFCHDKRFVIKGTEDMIGEYHNYWFHIKGALIGELLGFIVSIIIGLVVVWI